MKNVNKDFYDYYWSENMIDYLKRSSGSRWFLYLLNNIIDGIDPKDVKTVVDLGCGMGYKTYFLSQKFNKSLVLGTDFSKKAIASAGNYHKRKNLSFKVKDITTGDEKNKYDLITAFDVLEHIEDWKSLVKKLDKHCNKYLLFSSPVGRMRAYEKNIGHYRNFKRGEIENFLKGLGYKPIKKYYAGFPFYSPICRDLTNMFYKQYTEIPTSKMSNKAEFFSKIFYFLFRYCSTKKHFGEIFIGLFEK